MTELHSPPVGAQGSGSRTFLLSDDHRASVKAVPGLRWLSGAEWPVTPELGVSAVQPTPAWASSWQRERLVDSEHGAGLSSQSPRAAVCGLPQTRASRLLMSWTPGWCSAAVWHVSQDVFYLTARLLNVYLRFHRASPRMDEEYGDRKYHYFFSLFFLTTVLLHI